MPVLSDSLAGRLRRAFGLLVLLVVVVGAFGVVLLGYSAQQVQRLSAGYTPAVEANSRVLQLMLDAETGIQGYLLTGDSSFLEPYVAARDDVSAELDEAERRMETAGVDLDLRPVREAAATWLNDYARPVVSAERGSTVPAPLEGRKTFDAFREQQSAVATALGDERERLREESRRMRSLALPGLVGVTVLFTALAAAIASHVVESVRRPLWGLRDVLERLRMGEVTARAPDAGPRELRQVASAVNLLADEGDRLRVEQQAASKWRQRSREASRRVREELARDALLRTAATAIGEAMEVDRVWIRYVESYLGEPPSEDELGPLHAQWQRKGLKPLEHVPALTRGAVAGVRRLGETGEPFVVTNVVSSELSQSSDGRLLLAAEPRAGALVVAAVEGNDDLVGIAVLVSLEPRQFGEEELRAVQWICADLGRAFEHSRVYEQQLQLVDRLQDLDRQKTDFLSTVSHELRTPLTSIAGYAEMLAEGAAGAVTPRMASMLEVVQRNTERLTDLIEDLLALSRIESGAFRTSVVDVDLARVVRSAVRTLEPQASTAGVRLTTATPDGGLQVRGDEGQLERVVLNLVSNALKFTPRDGSVEVTVTAQGPEHAVLTVTDTGIGIPVAEQDQLFTRFFRASNAVTGAVPGTGLGLTIVRSIVANHGGEVTLTSAAGEGTAVRIRLPAGGRTPAGADRRREGEHLTSG